MSPVENVRSFVTTPTVVQPRPSLLSRMVIRPYEPVVDTDSDLELMALIGDIND